MINKEKLINDIAEVIRHNSMESVFNDTPDYILAHIAVEAMETFTRASARRDDYHGFKTADYKRKCENVKAKNGCFEKNTDTRQSVKIFEECRSNSNRDPYLEDDCCGCCFNFKCEDMMGNGYCEINGNIRNCSNDTCENYEKNDDKMGNYKFIKIGSIRIKENTISSYAQTYNENTGHLELKIVSDGEVWVISEDVMNEEEQSKILQQLDHLFF